MFSHIMVGANDIDASKQFYDAILGELGVKPGRADDKGRIFYVTPTGVFSISKPINGEPATPANGGTIGFAASTTEMVDRWHVTGLAHGGTDCEDPPGIRQGSSGQLYLAYLRDPAGNKLCALKRL